MDATRALDSHRTRDHKWMHNPHRTVVIQQNLGTSEKDTWTQSGSDHDAIVVQSPRDRD